MVLLCKVVRTMAFAQSATVMYAVSLIIRAVASSCLRVVMNLDLIQTLLLLRKGNSTKGDHPLGRRRAVEAIPACTYGPSS